MSFSTFSRNWAMRSNYKKLGPYIREIDVRNTEGSEEGLLGLSVQKTFLPTKANTIGTNFSNYKIVKKRQFSYTADTSRRGDKIAIALLDQWDRAMVSPIYTVFEIIDTQQLLPEYLMMWFRRPEFDRYARFMSHGSVRELFGWEEMCDVKLPIPSIDKQREIVKEYQTVVDRIQLNEQLNQKLEETAQAIYRHWFVDSEGENTVPLGELVEFNPKHTITKGAPTTYIEMSDVREDTLNVKNTVVRSFSAGSKFQNGDTLLARITPCLENGKTAFVNCLKKEEIGYGSTEFIVMRKKNDTSPYWVYCTAREEHFRSYAISSMVGSSGRQRVHSDYLEIYCVKPFSPKTMRGFHEAAGTLFHQISIKTREVSILEQLRQNLLSSLATKN